jgi:hypothetical protein
MLDTMNLIMIMILNDDISNLNFKSNLFHISLYIYRPLSSLFPDEKSMNNQMKDAVWSIIVESSTADSIACINFIYKHIGKFRLSDIFKIDI